EASVAGVTVELLTACEDGTLLRTTVTNGDGLYLFDELEPGNYVVHFVLPNGYQFTIANQGDDSLDSDADTTSGCTPAIPLEAGQTDLSWDAGIYVPEPPTEPTDGP